MRSLFILAAATATALMGASCSGTEGAQATGADMEPMTLPAGHSDFASLPSYGWRYSDTLRFTTPAATGELRVALRHSIRYPYRNIWLEVSVTPPGDTAVASRDTVEMELADPFGLWRGTGIGPTRQMEATVARAVSVDSGSTVTLRHIMRLDTLPAIEQAGIFIIH